MNVICWPARFPRRVLFAGLLAAGPVWAAAAHAEPDRIHLGGTWRFALDRGDVGIRERWHERTLPDRIRLPGALQNQGCGDEITVGTRWTGEVGAERWRQQPQYARYRQPGHLKVPFFLQPQKHYVGAAWYQRDVEIPRGWAGQRIVLTLERAHWETRVWLDDREIGSNNSLSTPHLYDLGHGPDRSLTAAKHTLTIRVDNRVLIEVGEWAHSVTDHTQGNWNGIVGQIELAATPRVWLDDLRVYPHVATRSVSVQGAIGNASGQSGQGTLVLAISPIPAADQPAAPEKASTTINVTWTERGGAFQGELALPPEAAFTAADECGFYYQIECGVWTQPGNGKPIDQWIYDESERIVRAYGNHPSFVLLTHGNEPHGPKHEQFLAGWVNHWKAKDPRRLYTSGSAYPQLPENQYHVYHGPRGPKGWLGRDYRDDVRNLTVPVIPRLSGRARDAGPMARLPPRLGPAPGALLQGGNRSGPAHARPRRLSVARSA
jgi:beta-galactosidase/beta-glucuronidase